MRNLAEVLFAVFVFAVLSMAWLFGAFDSPEAARAFRSDPVMVAWVIRTGFLELVLVASLMALRWWENKKAVRFVEARLGRTIDAERTRQEERDWENACIE